tara:strand:+ start:47 stop:484 length:438 start_codon:yes stop_codon:yes gene_type:complete
MADRRMTEGEFADRRRIRGGSVGLPPTASPEDISAERRRQNIMRLTLPSESRLKGGVGQFVTRRVNDIIRLLSSNPDRKSGMRLARELADYYDDEGVWPMEPDKLPAPTFSRPWRRNPDGTVRRRKQKRKGGGKVFYGYKKGGQV